MMEFLIGDYALLALAALFAGLVDAVVGGGGLIQLPALFSVLPQTVPASLFGTNKFAAIWGTLFAARTYARKAGARARPLARTHTHTHVYRYVHRP